MMLSLTGSPAAASAISPPPLTLLTGKAEERTIIFADGDDRGRIASLNVPLTAPACSRGPVTAQFLPASTRVTRTVTVPVAAEAPKAFGRGAVAVWLAEQPHLDRHRRGVVAVRFGLAAGQRPGVADGVLFIARPGAAPLTLPIVGSGPAYKLSPAVVKLTMGRGLFSGGDDSARLTVTASGGDVAAARRGPRVRAILHHGDQTMDASLTWDKAGSTDGRAAATVMLTHPGHAGTYTGDLVIEPASGQAVTLPLEVSVHHRFAWLVLTVLMGAAGGGLGVALYGRRRRRELIRAALHDEVERYEKLRDAQPVDLSEPQYIPPSLLGTGDRFPKGKTCDEDAGDLARAYCAANAAKSDADVEAATEQAQAVIAEFRHWIDIHRAVRGLVHALAAAKPRSDSTICQETHTLADQTCAAPPDDATADDLVARLGRQAQVLRDFAPAARKWDGLDGEHQKRKAHYDPYALYDQAGEETARDAAGTFRLSVALRVADRALARPDEPDDAGHRLLVDNVAPGVAMASLVDLMPSPKAGTPDVGDHRSAAGIRRNLKCWDLALAVVTLLLTVLVYAVGVYNDTWGSLTNYLSALGAGFFAQAAGGALVFNWDAFPWLRSYRLAARVKSPPPAAAGS